MEKRIEKTLYKKLNKIDPKILIESKLARESIFHLLRVREELDDFIDTLELLSDKNFRRNLKKGLEQYRKGETISSSIDELKKQLEE